MADESLLVQKLLKKLSQTQYACSELTKLSGGTANYLYRGTLIQPLDSQIDVPEAVTKTVVIKHSEDHVPGNRDFLLDIKRCVMMTPTFTRRHAV